MTAKLSLNTSASFTLDIWVGNINRSALAPVSAELTGANALRLIPRSSLDKALCEERGSRLTRHALRRASERATQIPVPSRPGSLKTRRPIMNTTTTNNRRTAIVAIGLAVVLVATLAVAFFPSSESRALAGKLKSDDSNVRYKAAKKLEDLGANAHEAVDELALALSDSDPKVRYRSAKALSKVGDPAVKAIPELIKALKDTDREVRYYTAKTLCKLGKAAEPARDAVIEALSDKDPEIRVYLVKSLKDTGEDYEPAMKAVKKLEKDPNPKVREAVKDAIEDLRD